MRVEKFEFKDKTIKSTPEGTIKRTRNKFERNWMKGILVIS